MMNIVFITFCLSLIKKDANFDEVPSTLKEAILEFYLGNTIRDLWGDTKSHRTMMINISRFVNVHEKN